MMILTPEQYEKRDAAFEAWFAEEWGCPLECSDGAKDVLRGAFNEGWAARKKAEYQ